MRCLVTGRHAGGDLDGSYPAPNLRAPENWIAPSLINNWVNASGGEFPSAGYYKDRQARVHLRGYLAVGEFATAFVLPIGYRPAQRSVFGGAGTSSFARIDVYATGEVARFAGSGSIVSLDGISFRAA